MKYRKWLIAIGYLVVAALAFVTFGFVAFKLIGVAGVAGVVFVALAILINGYIAKAEDDLPGGFNNPTSLRSNKPPKR